MIKTLLFAFLVGSTFAKIERFHVIKTDPISYQVSMKFVVL